MLAVYPFMSVMWSMIVFLLLIMWRSAAWSGRKASRRISTAYVRETADGGGAAAEMTSP
jgi:hypothetical protein